MRTKFIREEHIRDIDFVPHGSPSPGQSLVSSTRQSAAKPDQLEIPTSQTKNHSESMREEAGDNFRMLEALESRTTPYARSLCDEVRSYQLQQYVEIPNARIVRCQTAGGACILTLEALVSEITPDVSKRQNEVKSRFFSEFHLHVNSLGCVCTMYILPLRTSKA